MFNKLFLVALLGVLFMSLTQAVQLKANTLETIDYDMDEIDEDTNNCKEYTSANCVENGCKLGCKHVKGGGK